MRFCATPGCAVRVVKGHCPPHALMREQGRPNVDTRRLYQTRRWRILRASVLQDDPLCRVCHGHGVIEPAVDVDHIVPHRGEPFAFWDRDNLQALCHACHARKTQRGE